MWVEECTEGVCPCILDTMGQKTPNDNAVPLSTKGTRGKSVKTTLEPLQTNRRVHTEGSRSLEWLLLLNLHFCVQHKCRMLKPSMWAFPGLTQAWRWDKEVRAAEYSLQNSGHKSFLTFTLLYFNPFISKIMLYLLFSLKVSKWPLAKCNKILPWPDIKHGVCIWKHFENFKGL